MRTLRHVLGLATALSLWTGFICDAYGQQQPAISGCIVPTAESVLRISHDNLPAGFSGVVTRQFEIGGQRLQWFAVNYGGPPSGVLYVLDCLGQPLASTGIGFVTAFKDGPVVAGVPTVEVRYVPGSGPGLRLQNVALLQFRNEELSTLWDHASIDDFFGGPLGGGQSHFDWRYLDGGMTIQVTGTEEELADNKPLPKTTKHTKERFCFMEAAGGFTKCG